MNKRQRKTTPEMVLSILLEDIKRRKQVIEAELKAIDLKLKEAEAHKAALLAKNQGEEGQC